VSEHLQRRHVHTPDVECSLVLVADYAKVVEANVVIILRIVVPAHQRRPHVAVRKLLQLAEGVIQVKALELFGTQLLDGTVDLMLEAEHELRHFVVLLCIVMFLRSIGAESCRTVKTASLLATTCSFLSLFVLELLRIILCMAGSVMAMRRRRLLR
jgi:hypothetical protein